MVLTCIICSATCKKNETIICAICNECQHVDCAIKQMPNLTQSAKENITKVKPGYSFGCKKCSTSCLTNPMAKKMDAVEKQLFDLTNIIKDSITSQLADIKKDLAKSFTNSQQFEADTNKKVQELEFENMNLRKQLNRPDIIVSGLPSYLNTDDLYSTALSIGKACNVILTENDVNFCAWIRKKSAVLIKFNNVLKRDSLMKNYRSKYNLKLNEIMQTDIQNRIYLNNHLIPIEAKLHYMCRNKIKSGEIKSYRLLMFKDPIKVKLVYPDKNEVIFTATEFVEREPGSNIINHNRPDNEIISNVNDVMDNGKANNQNMESSSVNNV